LQSAVLNLLLNARDAMPGGGTITVATSNVEFEAGAVTLPPLDLEPGGYVVVTIRDTGVGMDAEMQARIFEPFFTTKEAGVGTGLGLAAVYGTAKNHKGAVGVRSSPGQGSEFMLYLPISRVTAARQHTEEPPSLRLHGHVVVIDDERVVRESEVRMLEALGCTVSSFADAESAIAYFEREHESVDLVVLDFVMPGRSGAETFQALRRIDPSVQVLVVSGYSLDEQVQRLIEAGAQGFLQKPFSMAALAGSVGPRLRR
jgi:CheY-like chemotaxis protein